MIGNKHITSICCVILTFAIVFNCVFMFRLVPVGGIAGYLTSAPSSLINEMTPQQSAYAEEILTAYARRAG